MPPIIAVLNIVEDTSSPGILCLAMISGLSGYNTSYIS